MSTTMDQVVKRAKDSFGQMFDKSLHDLVRGIRNHKDNEVKFSTNVFSKYIKYLYSRQNISMKLWMKLNKNLNKIISL
jgi:AP-3 complex subunit delta-1